MSFIILSFFCIRFVMRTISSRKKLVFSFRNRRTRDLIYQRFFLRSPRTSFCCLFVFVCIDTVNSWLDFRIASHFICSLMPTKIQTCKDLIQMIERIKKSKNSKILSIKSNQLFFLTKFSSGMRSKGKSA